MPSYQEIKNWIEENKQNVILVICFVLVFIIGFGAGRFNQELSGRKIKSETQTNYNTKPAAQATQAKEEGIATTPPETVSAEKVLGTAANKSCPVKGNPTSKIYHLPGGAFYEVLKSFHCFNSEAEAKAAGYKKSGR
jgi:hypothetical protein